MNDGSDIQILDVTQIFHGDNRSSSTHDTLGKNTGDETINYYTWQNLSYTNSAQTNLEENGTHYVFVNEHFGKSMAGKRSMENTAGGQERGS